MQSYNGENGNFLSIDLEMNLQIDRKIAIYMREIELGIKEKDTKNPVHIEIEEILNIHN